ncbi:MAG: esterase family protein, partial [Deltaproteobacteria bacterium]|nr:esterase family protein [Deltaproteobacteria bacterium]
MNVSYRKLYSPQLGQDFELKAYGHAGKPVLVFPTFSGRFWDYEGFGMFDVLGPFVEAGDIQVFCVDGRDWEGWNHPARGPHMGERHRAYERCIVQDVVPYVARELGAGEKLLATGTSFGAYHALNFALKFPDSFDACICLSGVYSLPFVLGGYYDETVYFNDIVAYLPGLTDEAIVGKLRRGYFVICHGRGPWEICNDQAAHVARHLESKRIPAWYSVWDERYPHDWWAWKEQL